MWFTKSAAERRYLSRVLVSMAGYVLAIAGGPGCLLTATHRARWFIC
jgi:hypothetical protein